MTHFEMDTFLLNSPVQMTDPGSPNSPFPKGSLGCGCATHNTFFLSDICLLRTQGVGFRRSRCCQSQLWSNKDYKEITLEAKEVSLLLLSLSCEPPVASFSEPLSRLVTAERLSPDCLWNNMCCYGESFPLAWQAWLFFFFFFCASLWAGAPESILWYS